MTAARPRTGSSRLCRAAVRCSEVSRREPCTSTRSGHLSPPRGCCSSPPWSCSWTSRAVIDTAIPDSDGAAAHTLGLVVLGRVSDGPRWASAADRRGRRGTAAIGCRGCSRCSCSLWRGRARAGARRAALGRVSVGRPEAAVLAARRRRCPRRLGWLVQARGVSAAHRPAQEDLRGALAAGDVPAVQVALRQGAQIEVVLVEPVEQLLGLPERLGGVVPAAGCQRCPSGGGVQLGELVPGRELAQQPAGRRL